MNGFHQDVPSLHDRSVKSHVLQAINDFESRLSELVEGISKFSLGPDLGMRLIESNSQLQSALSLLDHHQQAVKLEKRLTLVSDKLDEKLNGVIIELADCRKELQASLPISLENESGRNTERKIGAEELLTYATKITKFTHAPPGYNSNTQAENASLPWPSEDDLRKGVLALSARREAEGTQNSTEKVDKSVNNTTSNSRPQRRRSSLISYGERPIINPSAQPGEAVLNLDLFDPDEEDEES